MLLSHFINLDQREQRTQVRVVCLMHLVGEIITKISLQPSPKKAFVDSLTPTTY